MILLHSCCLLSYFQVLHPYLGISWFRKVDVTGHRAEMAKTLFKHAYEGYKAAEPVPIPVARKLTASSSTFLDDISMADSADEVTASDMPTIIFDELERFLQAYRIFGRGDPNGPLLWWKVSCNVRIYCFLPLNFQHLPIDP